jgi:DNA-binding beta-propeller fold protein YncE
MTTLCRRTTSALLLALVLVAGLTAPATTARAEHSQGTLYLPEVANDTIAVLDIATDTIVRRIPIDGEATRPAVMAATADGRKLYVDNFGVLPATVTVIDRPSGSTKNIRTSSVPLGAFISNDSRELFLPESGFEIEVLDTATDRIVRKFHFPDIPVGSIMGPDGLLYVGFAAGGIGVFDPRTGAQLRPTIYSGGLAPFWYTFTKDGDKLYTDTVNSIGVIDLRSWKLTKTVATTGRPFTTPLDPGAFTSTLSPDGSKLYVTLFGGTGVKVLDTTTDRIIGTIPTAGATTAVTFSPDGTRGYISDLGPTTAHMPTPVGEAFVFFDLITVGSLGPGQLVVFDPRTDRPLGAPIPTKAGPGVAVAVWGTDSATSRDRTMDAG